MLVCSFTRDVFEAGVFKEKAQKSINLVFVSFSFVCFFLNCRIFFFFLPKLQAMIPFPIPPFGSETVCDYPSMHWDTSLPSHHRTNIYSVVNPHIHPCT